MCKPVEPGKPREPLEAKELWTGCDGGRAKRKVTFALH